MFAPVASATSAVEGLSDAVAGTQVGWLLGAVLLRVAGQLSRGFAWGAVLGAAWKEVSPRRACVWHVCGAGFTGVLSARPRRFLRQVLPWQIAGRLLRLASLGCFLHAFGLPAGPAVIIAASVTQGPGRMLPIPGAGTAAAAAALLQREWVEAEQRAELLDLTWARRAQV